MFTEKSPKIKPLCPVFGICGGCSYQDISYEYELALKNSYIHELFLRSDHINDSAIETITPSPEHYFYRNRIDLKLIKTRDKTVHIGFTPKEQRKRVVEIDECFIARKEISGSIKRIKKEAEDILPEKYKNANLVVRTGDNGSVLWGGIGKRSLRRDKKDFLWTEIYGKKIFYSLDTFFQANLFILPLLFERINKLDIWSGEVSLFDLYGGVGLFSICLYDNAEDIFLIEENKWSIDIAKHNIEYNDLKKISVAEGRVEDELSKVLDIGKKNRINVAVVDPPRAGLSKDAVVLLKRADQFDHIVYLSCNPDALFSDVQRIAEEGWDVKLIAPFDFFPRTKHIETLAIFSRE